jgi:hypothetical protein
MFSHCPHCGSQLEADCDFCPSCGMPKQQPQVSPQYQPPHSWMGATTGRDPIPHSGSLSAPVVSQVAYVPYPVNPQQIQSQDTAANSFRHPNRQHRCSVQRQEVRCQKCGNDWPGVRPDCRLRWFHPTGFGGWLSWNKAHDLPALDGMRSPSFEDHFALPTLMEWWQSVRYVLLIITIAIALALAGSFVSYEQVANGHPWLPSRPCPGCPFCGMTRSFCAMSSGRWQEALTWNRGGPVLYVAAWLWLSASTLIGPRLARISLSRLASNPGSDPGS